MNMKNRISRVAKPVFEALETRQHMSASAVKVVDSGGPIEQIVEAGGRVYVASRHGPGSAISQIYVADGAKKNTRLLLDLTQPGATISNVGDLTATNDGRVYFTASARGGRQVFQLNTKNGGFTQLTDDTNVFYVNAVAAGNRVFFYDTNAMAVFALDGPSAAPRKVIGLRTDTTFFPSGSDVYFVGPNEQLFRSNGTAKGTVPVSGSMKVGRRDFFATNNHVYFESTVNNLTSLYRVSANGTAPERIAEDFSLDGNLHAELGEYVYFGGFFFSTSPLSKGRELYRVRIADGAVELAADVSNGSGSGVGLVSAIGNSVYFVNNDGEFIPSQGTGDRELYRYDPLKRKTTLVTQGNQLFPTELGQGVLGSYYFVAAPSKDDARFGARALYRTNPATDEVELISGVPTVKNANGRDYQGVRALAVGSRGLFFSADSADLGRDNDVFFVATPFSQANRRTGILTIEATASADVVTMTRVADEIVVTLNGREERHAVQGITRIEAYLRAGNDTFTSDETVAINTYAFGDVGDDLLTGGAGNDTLTGGAGKNRLFGGSGNDRLNGSNGRDSINGQAGEDRLYGKGGDDILEGGDGIDRLFGDEREGPFGNDVLRGGSSNDKLYGYGGNDTLIGDRQNDLLFGGDGDDVLMGGDGNDFLDGEAGNDVLLGELGNDVLVSRDGAAGDSLDGGDGADEADADGSERAIDRVEALR